MNKHVPSYVLREADLRELDDGLKLDAGENTHGSGWTFGTVSSTLAVQYRVIQRMLGRSTSIKCVTNHGGFGLNPIYRIGVRVPSEGRADKRLRVKVIHREVGEVPCYDIATDDHYVYLPEADCTVSNCDDLVLLLMALFESVNLPWKFVLAGIGGGQKVRYVEGQPFSPEAAAVKWSHIYGVVGVPPFQPTQWYFVEPTIRGAPLGWDVLSGNKSYLPELSTKQDVASSFGDAGAEMEPAVAKPIDWRNVGVMVATYVTVSITSALVLDWINGRGIWERKGHILQRAHAAAEPAQHSIFAAQGTQGA